MTSEEETRRLKKLVRDLEREIFEKNLELEDKTLELDSKIAELRRCYQIIEWLTKRVESLEKINLTLARKQDIITVNNQISTVNQTMNESSDQSQKINVGGDLSIDATNSVVNLRDISGQVTNTINQLPPSPENKPGIKELLTQLQESLEDPNLSQDDKQQTLQQIQTLAEAGQNPKDETLQKKAKKAIGFLQVIAQGVEPVTKLATTCKDVIPLITAWFGF